YRYALGYVNKNNSCRSHKVLRFIDNYISLALNHAPENRFSWYEIYDIETDLWTTLDVPPYWRISCYQQWNSGYKLDDHIICFDFTSERFGPLMRLPFRAGHHDYVTLSCVREEKLAALLTHNESNPYEFEIWITTKIESEKVSWSKILEMDTGPLADRPIAFTRESFFVDEEKNVSMGFDDLNRHTVNIIGEAGYFIELDLGVPVADLNSRPHLCPYLPNSVQIKQPPGGKRKRKTILEKRRYDQIMLRLAAFIKRTKQEENKWRKRVGVGLKKKTIFEA
ncbi:F-box associated domain type 1, partial [Arabidopsis suecica]